MFASSPRVSGTEGEEKALSLTEECVQDIGFSVKREEFRFKASIPLESYLQVGDVKYEVLPVGYSKSGKVEGNRAFIESLESRMLEDLEGHIAVYPDYFYERTDYASLLAGYRVSCP